MDNRLKQNVNSRQAAMGRLIGKLQARSYNNGVNKISSRQPHPRNEYGMDNSPMMMNKDIGSLLASGESTHEKAIGSER